MLYLTPHLVLTASLGGRRYRAHFTDEEARPEVHRPATYGHTERSTILATQSGFQAQRDKGGSILVPPDFCPDLQLPVACVVGDGGCQEALQYLFTSTGALLPSCNVWQVCAQPQIPEACASCPVTLSYDAPLTRTESMEASGKQKDVVVAGCDSLCPFYLQNSSRIHQDSCFPLSCQNY